MTQLFNYKRDTKSARSTDIYTPKGYDACQTPGYALDPLLPYLRPSWRIWEPAAGDGYLVAAIRQAGFTVRKSDVITRQNFFDYQPMAAWDCIVTNPPYSIKYKFLNRCYRLGKPFALLVPVETIGAQTAQNLFKQYGVELLLLNRRVNFKMPNAGWKGSAQFPVLWLCWQVLPAPICYGNINPVKQDPAQLPLESAR